MNKQIKFYENKLAYEMDPSDLYDGFENSTEYIALDARQAFGFDKEHIPTESISMILKITSQSLE